MSHQHVVLLSIPGLRGRDLGHMPRLSELACSGTAEPLTPSFPCLTWPVQTTLATGVSPEQHGMIANGLFHRETGEVEMWTAWNDAVQSTQVWDRLHNLDHSLTSAVWFPMLAKGCGADYVCIPAPKHNADGTETMWCHTKPEPLYEELLDELGHFPLINFWGPLANIKSTDWIVDSAVLMAKQQRPRFSFIYLQHLDYAAQKFGPESQQATTALGELDSAIGRLIDGFTEAGMDDILWLAASEYVITPVSDVSYPNRILRDAGFLTLKEADGGEVLVPGESRAWAMVDHQLAHVFVKSESDIPAVAEVLNSDPLVERVLVGEQLNSFGLDNPRSGEIVIISQPEAWFAYYWWLDDDRAPSWARTVDIHRKPGYDPVEMFIDMPSRQTPLDATLVGGSHGYPADADERRGILLSSDASVVGEETIHDRDIAGMVLRNFQDI